MFSVLRTGLYNTTENFNAKNNTCSKVSSIKSLIPSKKSQFLAAQQDIRSAV